MSAFTNLSYNKIDDSSGETNLLWFFVGNLFFPTLF
jgi:hypothetical protein